MVKAVGLRGRLAALKARAESEAASMQHTATAAGSAFVLGAMEKKLSERNLALPAGAPMEEMATIAGIDHKLAYGAGLYLLGMFGSGKIAEVAHGAADGILSVYAYEMAKTPTPPRR